MNICSSITRLILFVSPYFFLFSFFLLSIILTLLVLKTFVGGRGRKIVFVYSCQAKLSRCQRHNMVLSCLLFSSLVYFWALDFWLMMDKTDGQNFGTCVEISIYATVHLHLHRSTIFSLKLL